MSSNPTAPRFACEVRVQFLPEQSDTANGPYAFAYTITVRNTGGRAGQLIARQWLITDAHGRTQEVRGLAVVGRQPLLAPGESFEYTSWTQVATPHGQMRGIFFCMTDDARPFEAEVAAFDLVYPGLLH